MAIRITDPDSDTDPNPDPDRDTGKTSLGGGMHCPGASSSLDIFSVRQHTFITQDNARRRMSPHGAAGYCTSSCVAASDPALTPLKLATCRLSKNRFHDRTGCQTGCRTGLTTVLNEQLFVQPVVKPGCTTGLTTGLTTGCIVYTNIYPVVKPVCQPV